MEQRWEQIALWVSLVLSAIVLANVETSPLGWWVVIVAAIAALMVSVTPLRFVNLSTNLPGPLFPLRRRWIRNASTETRSALRLFRGSQWAEVDATGRGALDSLVQKGVVVRDEGRHGPQYTLADAWVGPVRAEIGDLRSRTVTVRQPALDPTEWATVTYGDIVFVPRGPMSQHPHGWVTDLQIVNHADFDLVLDVEAVWETQDGTELARVAPWDDKGKLTVPATPGREVVGRLDFTMDAQTVREAGGLTALLGASEHLEVKEAKRRVIVARIAGGGAPAIEAAQHHLEAVASRVLPPDAETVKAWLREVMEADFTIQRQSDSGFGSLGGDVAFRFNPLYPDLVAHLSQETVDAIEANYSPIMEMFSSQAPRIQKLVVRDLQALLRRATQQPQPDGTTDRTADGTSADVLVGVTTFLPHMAAGQLIVTNISGQQDTFSAQVVGCCEGEFRPREARRAWDVSWNTGDKAMTLNNRAKATIDFVELRKTAGGHVVDPDSQDPFLRDRANRLDVLVNGCDRTPLPSLASGFFYGTWHGPMRDFERRAWTFLLRITGAASGRYQDVLVTLLVIAASKDDPLRLVQAPKGGVHFLPSPEVRLLLPDDLPPLPPSKKLTFHPNTFAKQSGGDTEAPQSPEAEEEGRET